MRIHFIWFTFRHDGFCALESLRSVGKFAPGAKTTFIQDAAFPLKPEHRAAATALGAEVLSDGARRFGNLNGLENLQAQLKRMKALGGDADWIVKIDSDTVLNAAPESWLAKAEPGHAAVCAGQPHWWFQGCCYALRADVPERLLAMPESERTVALREVEKPRYPEDVCTAHLVCHLLGPESILTLPGHSVVPELSGDQLAHYRYRRPPEFEKLEPFRVLTFGDRDRLAPQLPDAVRRLEAARAMRRWLDWRLPRAAPEGT